MKHYLEGIIKTETGLMIQDLGYIASTLEIPVRVLSIFAGQLSMYVYAQAPFDFFDRLL